MHRQTRRGLALALGMLGLVALTAPAGAAMTATRTSAFAYDAASGLLTQEVIEPDTPALRLETDYAYDAFGHKISATVSGGDAGAQTSIATRTSTTAYDAQGEFPTSRSNALNQTERWIFDPRFGQPTSHTGPNGLTTSWRYDGLGRKLNETRPDGTQTAWSYQYCSGANGGTASCPAGAVYLVQTTPLAADGKTPNGPQATSYFDVLGRVIAADTQGFDGCATAPCPAPLVRVTTQYDSFGRVQQTSQPYFVNGGTPVFTSLAYDALGRPSQTTFPDGSTAQYAYHGLTTSVTNALNQTRTTVKDTQGRVISVSDALNQVTHYAYDPTGNLLQTTDPAGNVTTSTYNTRGFRTGQNDPDMGAWSYQYDALGELVGQSDAKGQATTLSYDVLGRLVQRVEADMTCVWSYDTAPMGIGKLAVASITAGPSAGYQQVPSYDSLGRVVQVALTVDGTTYTTTTSYDANGRVSQASYPSGFAVQYGYTALGYQQQLAAAATGQVYWTATARDASLRLTQQAAGNGVVTTQSFDAHTGFLTGVTAGSGGAVASFAYTYDALGNLLSRSDANDTVVESFSYDGLNRLTAATLVNGPAKSFSYDVLGNITAKSDVGTYSYPAAGAVQPHGVVSISGGALVTSFTYDANGNQTGGAGRSIGYASFNKPSSITQGGTTIAFTHDPGHQRLKQTAPEGTTLYLGAGGLAVEKFTGAGGAVQWNEYLTAGGELVGVRFERSDGTAPVRYFHKDHLGSVAVLSDESGAVVQRQAYDAWGKRRFPNGADDPTGSVTSPTTRGFTGQEELADVGLVHMNGRVYDPQLGRFTSADPRIQDVFNGQTYNRYSYVINNPLAFTDPTGYDFFSDIGHFFGAVLKASFDPDPAAGFAVVRQLPGQHQFDHLYQTSPLFRTAAGLAAAVADIWTGGLASAFLQSYETYEATGSRWAAIRIGAITYATAQGFAAVGGSDLSFTGKVLAEGTIGGLSSVAQGGNFVSGFLAAGFSKLAGPALDSLDWGSLGSEGAFAGRLAASVVIGGTASVIGGGKFENGAITGAFQYIFNDFAHDWAKSGAVAGGIAGGGAVAFGSVIADAGTLGINILATPAEIVVGAYGGAWIGGGIGYILGTVVDAADTIVNNTRPGDLPAQGGPPDGSAAKDNGNGKGQIRDYGSDGRAVKDFDFGHDHGSGDPHVHDWDWSQTPPRLPGRPLGPNE